VVVQNQTDREMTVDVAVRAANASLLDGAGRRVVVAANDRAEVRFPVAAARAGTARFQVGALAGAAADAAELQLPVWTPATTEAFKVLLGHLNTGLPRLQEALDLIPLDDAEALAGVHNQLGNLYRQVGDTRPARHQPT
jgi:hypothetical protein